MAQSGLVLWTFFRMADNVNDLLASALQYRHARFRIMYENQNGRGIDEND